MKQQYNIRLIRKRWILLILTCWSSLVVGQIQLEMSSTLTMEGVGNIQVETEGNWLSQGMFLPGVSTLLLHGPHNQFLKQDGGAFRNLTIQKSNANVLLTGDIHVDGGTLTVSNGDVDLNTYRIMLDASAQLSESPGQTVKGASGYITTTRTLSAPAGNNIAGMGLSISSVGDFGSTEIRRGHAAQSGNMVEGIQRYFDFLPSSYPPDHMSIQFYYDESELNGNTEAELKLYGSSDYGLHWIECYGTVNTIDNYFTATNVPMFSRYTLSSHCLESCLATEAIAVPVEVFLNAAGLGFVLPESMNDGSRGACGIDSLKVYPDAFDCSDLGWKNVIFSVKDNLGCMAETVASVLVMDTVKPIVVCKNIILEMGDNCEMTIQPSDVDNGSFDACGLTLSLDVNVFTCDDIGSSIPVTLTGMDVSGNSSFCIATVSVVQTIEVTCQDVELEIGSEGSVEIDPLDLVMGDPDDFEGFTFIVNPAILYCDQLGEHIVTLTATDPDGNVTVCETMVFLEGPDADCDDVADQCDLCEGGDDQQDSDNDGVPDCADWDGWASLPDDWQCANNKVFVCHEGNVICINQNAVQAHLDHGDILGPCDATACPQTSVAQLSADEEHLAEGIPVENDLPGLNEDPDEETNEQLVAINYPNPFYPETRIRFYLPVRGEVVLVVFDLLGQPVAKILDEEREAGWHEAVFDGSTQTDGVYLFRLQLQNQSITKPMVLIRK